MRTTIDLPDAMFRELKEVAARQGRSMKEVARGALARELSRARRSRRRGCEAKLPLIRSKTPGVLRSLTNADIEDLLD